MNVREELVERCARRRAEKLGGLSPQAYDELLLAARENVDGFVDTPQEQAFAQVGRALDRYAASVAEDEYADEEQYAAVRSRRLRRLYADCGNALATDPGCLDARLLQLLARGEGQDLSGEIRELLTSGPPQASWDDVFARPALRAQAALCRELLAGIHLTLAEQECNKLLEIDPADELGCRHTLALTLVRLEDEDGFDALDARFGRQGRAWEHLGRVILMYKLGRANAARRALRGYDSLVRGGAYVLLRPVLAEPYLPDRPEVPANDFGEAVMAVNEAEATIADTPDFVWWCEEQDWFVRSAMRFADQSGFDWDE